MPRLTTFDFFEASGFKNVQDMLNTMRNTATPMYQRNVPEATLQNIQLVGQGINMNPSVQNEFLSLLVEQVYFIGVSSPKLNNDFKIFTKDMTRGGVTVERVFIDKIEATPFDMYYGEDEAFSVVKPDIKVIFHTRNRREKYPITISEEDLESAFRSGGQLAEFVTGIFNSLITSNEADEYEYTMALFDNYQEKGLFYQIAVPDMLDNSVTRDVQKERTEDFIETVQSTVGRLGLGNGSRDYNAMGVLRRSLPEDLYLFITPELKARYSVKVLATAFNMSEAEFKSHVFVFSGFSDKSVLGALVDKEWFQIFVNKRRMAKNYNGANLSTKYFYHNWNTFSVDQLENAICFTTDETNRVYHVGFNIQEVDVRAGKQYTPKFFVKSIGEYDKNKVKFELVGAKDTDTELIVKDGKPTVKVAIGETARTLTLKISYDNGKEEQPNIVKGYCVINPVKQLER